MTAPKRWSEGGDAVPGEEQAQQLFSSAASQPVVAPSPEVLKARWQAAQAKSAGAVAGSSAVIGKVIAGAVAATLAIGGLAWLSNRPREAPVAAPVAVQPEGVPVAPASPVIEAPSLLPPPKPARPRVVAVAAPPEAKAVEDLGDAQLVLSAATLVREGRVEQALTVLEEREHRYSRSAQSGPAGLVQIEALRLSHKFDQALERLAWLEHEQLFPSGRLAELPLIRAELLLAAGRCDEARPVFERMATEGSLLSTRAKAGLTACDELLLDSER